MATKKYIVNLTADQREHLLQLIGHDKHPSRKVMRAHILIKANEGLTDKQIAAVLNTSVPTIERTRRRFVEESLGALDERPRPGRRRKLNTRQEKYLITIFHSTPPRGYKEWTLRSLAHRIIELGFADSISLEAVRRLRKKFLSPDKSSGNTFQR